METDPSRRRDSGIRAVVLTTSEVRERILAEHRRLRRQLIDVQVSAREAVLEPLPLALVRARLRTSLVECAMHLDSEEELLIPVLTGIDAWGPLRVLELKEEHEGQRNLIKDMLARAEREESAETLAAEADALVLRIFRDMREEEDGILREEMLHDDVVVVDQCGG